MWGTAVLAAISIGNYIYHRWFDEPPKPKPAPELTLPRVDDGAPYAIYYGTCRIKNVIVAYTTKPISFYHQDGDDLDRVALGPEDSPIVIYFVNMMLVLGIPFLNGEQTLYNMWMGDEQLSYGSAVQPWELRGDGTDFGLNQCNLFSRQTSAKGSIEFLNGYIGQQLVQRVSPFASYSEAGFHMINSTTGGNDWENPTGTVDPTLVPGYRGFTSVFLYGRELQPDSGKTLLYWLVGETASIPQFSFEARTLPTTYLGPAASVPVDEGDGLWHDQGDANPVDVLYDLLTGTHGKLALPTSRIHLASFQAAATTLYNEGNGFSYAFTQGMSANDIIEMILTQVDGIIYEDPVDGLIRLKLVRNDYDPLTVPVINPTNCVDIKNFAAGGWTDVPNKVRITYSNRLDNYNDDSAVAHNQANAIGQDGQVREVQISMPGVTSWGNATAIATRELMARSRPLLKCRVIVDRTFRNIVPGDVVKLNWPKWKLSNAIMRVASVNRGTVGSNSVAIDLIQDYYYVWKSRPPVGGGGSFLAPPPTTGAPVII